MPNNTRLAILLIILCALATIPALYILGGYDSAHLQALIEHAGLWAPILYFVLYILATSLLLPSTPLNLTGGAIFGLWMGLLWSSLAAVLAAVVSFALTRTVGREYIAERMAGRVEMLDGEVRRGGKFYIFAVRLLPIVPHGLINYGAGLTSISFRDYLIGTVPGTILGVLPPVLLGSAGLKAIRTGDVLPLVGAMALTGLAVAGATWYRRRRTEAESVSC